MRLALLPAPVQALVAAALGALATYAGLALLAAASRADQPILWWAGRAFGFLAFIALALSVIFGTLVSARGGGFMSSKWATDLHQQWTIAALIATVAHVVVLVLHAESGVTPWAALIPFASARLTGPVALGTVALLGMVLVAVSSWARRMIPYTAWRAVHGLAFGVAVLALMHSATAGTDTHTPAVTALYVSSTAAILGTVTMRLLHACLGRRWWAPARGALRGAVRPVGADRGGTPGDTQGTQP